tara:strand:- start:736 stop:1056 length:321 start_codon:yes stop_codon:yes gene_type:complete
MSKKPKYKAPPIKGKKKKKGGYSVSKDSSGISASYTLPSGGSIGFSKNPHSKGINFSSSIGDQSYVDASADDQGSYRIGFRKKFAQGGDIEKHKDQVKRKYGGGKL